jgi:hypothetical protein
MAASGFDTNSHIVGLDGILAHSSIGYDKKADKAGASKIHNLIQGCAHCPAGVKHIVAKDDDLVGDIHSEIGTLDYGLGTEGGEIVAVEGDINLANGDLLLVVLFHEISKATGDMDAAGLDAKKNKGGVVGKVAMELSGQDSQYALQSVSFLEHAFDGKIFGHGGGGVLREF